MEKQTEVVVALEAKARKLGLSDEALDEAVHEQYSHIASNINNEGFPGQLASLLEFHGSAEAVESLLEELAAQ